MSGNCPPTSTRATCRGCGLVCGFRDVEPASEALLDGLHSRLPWSPLAPFALAAKRHGVNLRLDEDAHERALVAVASHYIELAGGRAADAEVMLALQPDRAVVFTTVMVAETVIGQLATMPDLGYREAWVA